MTCSAIRSSRSSCTWTSSAWTRTRRCASRCRCTSSTRTSRRPARPPSVVITHELNEVEVSCLPKDLPEFIEIDLADAGRRRHRPPVGPQAAEGRRAPGAEAGQGTRRRRRDRQARPASKSKKPPAAGSRPKCRRPRPPRRTRSNRAARSRPPAHRRGGRLRFIDGWLAPHRRAGQSRARTRPDPAQRRVLVCGRPGGAAGRRASGWNPSCSARPPRSTSPASRSGCSSRPPS